MESEPGFIDDMRRELASLLGSGPDAIDHRVLLLLGMVLVMAVLLFGFALPRARRALRARQHGRSAQAARLLAAAPAPTEPTPGRVVHLVGRVLPVAGRPTAPFELAAEAVAWQLLAEQGEAEFVGGRSPRDGATAGDPLRKRTDWSLLLEGGGGVPFELEVGSSRIAIDGGALLLDLGGPEPLARAASIEALPSGLAAWLQAAGARPIAIGPSEVRVRQQQLLVGMSVHVVGRLEALPGGGLRLGGPEGALALLPTLDPSRRQ